MSCMYVQLHNHWVVGPASKVRMYPSHRHESDYMMAEVFLDGIKMPRSVRYPDPLQSCPMILSPRLEVKMLLQAGVTSEPRVVLAILLLLFVWLSYSVFFRRRSPYPLPPGPPVKLLVGNLGQLSNHPEQDYIRWGKEYSESSLSPTKAPDYQSYTTKILISTPT